MTLLLNPTRDRVIRTLDKLRGSLTERDNLLLYYAGHGVLDAEAEIGFWLPVDAEEGTQSNWIAVTTVTRTAKAMSAKHVMIVADSCYSGTLIRATPSGIKSGAERLAELKRLTEKRSRTALVSGGLEPVTDAGGYGHSVFARAFLTALRENAEVLEGHQLFAAVRGPVVLNADQTPQYSDIRLAGHDGGDFLFVPLKVNLSELTTSASQSATTNEGPSEQAEISFWEAIKDSTNPAEFEAYLRKFPGGVFDGLARIKRAALQSKQTAGEAEGEPVQAVPDEKKETVVAGVLFPAKRVIAPDIPKLVSKDAHETGWFALSKLPAIQFDRAELDGQGDYSGSLEVVMRDGSFTVVRQVNNEGKTVYRAYVGITQLNAVWSTKGTQRKTLKVFDVKPVPFSVDEPVIDAVSAQDLSAEFKWDPSLPTSLRHRPPLELL